MKNLIVIALWGLIAIAVLPLVALALYILADKLGFARLADRILDVIGPLMSAQWITGGIVNLLGGLAICALGFWSLGPLFSAQPLSPVMLLSPLLIPFGLWRSWRGFTVLYARKGPTKP